MSLPPLVRTDLAVDGACTYELSQLSSQGGLSVELFHILKSHPAPDMPQITVSRSKRNVIRGLHCSPHHKIVCCPSGRAFDVIVDLRPNSPTFLKWAGAWLSKTKHIVIPPFCAHGFFAAEEDTSILYLQGGCFAPALDFSLKFDDPSVGIEWPAPIDAEDYIISPKDRENPLGSQELYDKIRERLEKPIESLKLGPYADFAIIADRESELIQKLIEGIQSAGKKWHFCHSNGSQRETLQEELYALKPLVGVLYLANGNDGDLIGNFTKILNVVAAADVRKFPLTILLGEGEFTGRDIKLILISQVHLSILLNEKMISQRAGLKQLNGCF
jgi:dTDP-4-dehydrorhamnose 3,5-epimerase